MKTVIVEFYANTKYVGCEITEEIELIVPNDFTDEEIDQRASEEYDWWVQEQISGGHTIKGIKETE